MPQILVRNLKPEAIREVMVDVKHDAIEYVDGSGIPTGHYLVTSHDARAIQTLAEADGQYETYKANASEAMRSAITRRASTLKSRPPAITRDVYEAMMNAALQHLQNGGSRDDQELDEKLDAILKK